MKQSLDLKNRVNSKALVLDILFYIAGSAIYALSVNCFSAPNNIAPGGATGLATVINYLVEWLPIGTLMFAMNIPLLLTAWFKLGKSFTLRTLVALGLVSTLIDVTAPYLPVFTDDMILTCLFGGVLAGLGLGLIFIRGATTGGSDIIGRLLEKRFRGIPVGRLMLMVDGVIVAISALVFGNVESALYAALFIFISMEVMDSIVYGRGGGKMVLIMSSHPHEIADKVLEEMDRGVTFLQAKGGYTGDEREVVMVAASRSEVYALRQLVKRIDPKAFLIISSADEVRGEGFTPHDAE